MKLSLKLPTLKVPAVPRPSYLAQTLMYLAFTASTSVAVYLRFSSEAASNTFGGLIALMIVYAIARWVRFVRNQPKEEALPRTFSGRWLAGMVIVGMVIGMVFMRTRNFRVLQPNLEQCAQILGSIPDESQTPCPDTWSGWKTIYLRHMQPVAQYGTREQWAQRLADAVWSSYPDYNVGLAQTTWLEYLQTRRKAVEDRLVISETDQIALPATVFLVTLLCAILYRLPNRYSLLTYAVQPLICLLLLAIPTIGWYFPALGILPPMEPEATEAVWGILWMGVVTEAIAANVLPTVGQIIGLIKQSPQPYNAFARFVREVATGTGSALIAVGILRWVVMTNMINVVVATPSLYMGLAIRALLLGTMAAGGAVTLAKALLTVLAQKISASQGE